MHPRLTQWLPFLSWARGMDRQSLRRDLMAGVTGAVIALPQGIAYALIAGLPAAYGIYSAIVTCILASLFGSSRHMVSGPTAALSIVVASVVGSTVTAPHHYISAVLTLTFLVGVIQLVFGLLRLGTLVNFISHTVVVGFTAGAAILIATSQFKYLLGVSLPHGLAFAGKLEALVHKVATLNPYALAIGITTLGTAVLVRKFRRQWPHLLIGLAMGTLLSIFLGGQSRGIQLIGALSGSLPPFTPPDLSLSSLQTLGSGAFAIALLGLIEAVSIARAIALRSHQAIDGNQEFIGQGVSNLVGSLFSSFVGSGSFTRSGANYDAGAQTPLAAILSSVLLALVLMLAPGITAVLPLPAMAGAILLIAWNLIDREQIAKILRANRQEVLVLVVTLLSTLFIRLEYAIYVGVGISLILYLRRTSQPRVISVAPIQDHPQRLIRNVLRHQLQECPQLKLIRLDGSLFFGATDHVQQQIRQMSHSPQSRLLVIAKGVNFIDIAGAEMLVQEAERMEKSGGQLLISSLKGPVLNELESSGHLQKLSTQWLFLSPEAAIARMVPRLDHDICAGCSARIFNECRHMPSPVIQPSSSTRHEDGQVTVLMKKA